MMRGLSLVIMVLGLMSSADATKPVIDYANTQLADPVQERKARALMETIRCVVCQGQSIADSNAGLAVDMRGVIRERIEQGEDPDELRAWLIERYGAWVSFKPMLRSDTVFLWILPFLSLAIGVLLARSIFRRKKM